MSSLPSDSGKKSDTSSSKSLTPQRKHRKLLKDGSGTEVWPESIENIFVQGLHEYWNSPWATYSQSRGRSRWRNQFLVDYLQKAGISRTKKQVASHIQVLRNMWKGEPEFYLVAGGEELYLEIGASDLIKSEERYDTTTLIPLDPEDNEEVSPNSTSSDLSPLGSNVEFASSPYLTTILGSTEINHVIPLHTESRVASTPSSINLSTHPPQETLSQTNSRKHLSRPHPPLISTPSSASALPAALSQLRNVDLAHNRATAICLLADGMTPFSIKLDALTQLQDSSRTTLALKIKLCITPVNDIRSPSSLHGFAGSVCLARVWESAGKCVTRVYANNICISEEVGSLDISNVEVGTAIAVLPESPLSRCRWLDEASPTTLTQEIIVDGETLIYIIYDLDRKNGGTLPSAELLGYQKYKAANKTPIPTTSPSQPSISTAHTPLSQPMSYSRRTAQTSLSCALAPVGNMRHLVATSISL